MTDHVSLFAKKLRAYRASAGTHGRMTQEELALLLDVSVDAIGKYERSLSFVRGDLEHRLSDKLGWSRDEIVACREDWETRTSPNQTREGYRILRHHEIVEAMGSVPAVNNALVELEAGVFGDLPNGFSVDDPIWLRIMERHIMIAVHAMIGEELVGHVALLFFAPELEERFDQLRLVEGDLEIDLLRRPILPGNYFAYCPAVFIAPGHERMASRMLSGFVEYLEEFAEGGIFVSRLGAIAANSLGRQLCADLGLKRLGLHADHRKLEFWQMPGSDITHSLLGRRSPKLRRAYSEQFGPGA